jgi:general secretion pathway protein L
VNPVLERQLARLRTRLAKTPLPGFFRWWGSELLACLPPRWRALVEERSESLLLDPRPDEIIVWRERGDRASEYARVSRSLPPEAQGAEFQRLRAAIDDPGVRTVLCIPSERVLQRNLVLPAAAEDNLRQVLSFEMDRQTPFKADQIYFDSRVLGRDASGRNLNVELVLLPRAQLDQAIGTLPPSAAASIDGVDAWRGDAGGRRLNINLLPQERRARRRDVRLPLNLGLAALAVILLIVNMNESLANREAAVDAMRAEVEKSNNDARQVAALRKTLADSVAGANFLTDKKRNNPLTVALLDDLSRRLPEDTYLERLQIDDAKAQLQGQSKEAAKLIALIGASDCLSNPSLQGQIQPDARTGKERFQITADVKPCNAPAFGANAAAATGKAGAAHANATAERAESKAPPKAIAKPVPASPENSKPASSKPVPSKPEAPKADASKPASQQKAATPTRPNATTPAKPLSQPKAATAPSKPSGTPPAARAGAQKPHEAVSGPRVPHEARVPREKEKTPASNALQEAAHGDH